jgi:hypothetical protein
MPCFISGGRYIIKREWSEHSVRPFDLTLYSCSRKRSLREQPDVHARLMSMYPEVPDWWYAGVFVVMFVAGAVAVELWQTQLPIWAYVMALAIAFAYVLPVGIILAVTNQQVSRQTIPRACSDTYPGRTECHYGAHRWVYVVCSSEQLLLPTLTEM